MKILFRKMVPIEDWRLVVNRLGLKWVEDTKGIIAYDEGSGERLAGCIINNWTHSACQVHFWIDRPIVIRHGFIHEIVNYVFVTAQRNLMIAWVPGGNVESLKLVPHLGFRETHRIVGGFRDDEDCVIFEATKEDLARWLQEKYDGEERYPGRPGLRSSGAGSGAVVQRSDEYADLRQPPESIHSIREHDVDARRVH